ncbi:MAG: DUF2735 domain-containing protein [Rhodobacteraceae bacterium]|nr:DUF2735 domain-containing protein [Paracoccaceae bacterium]
MTTKSEQTSAKIYQFPTRPLEGRAPLAQEGALGPDLTPAPTPQIVYGSAWYHQVEIDKGTSRR